MQQRKARMLLLAGDGGKKAQRTVHMTDTTWQSAEMLRAKMPGSPTMGELFETLVNFARMTPEAFGLALPEGDAPVNVWKLATWLAKGNGLASPGRLLDRLIGVVALFPERFFMDEPEKSVGILLAKRDE